MIVFSCIFYILVVISLICSAQNATEKVDLFSKTDISPPSASDRLELMLNIVKRLPDHELAQYFSGNYTTSPCNTSVILLDAEVLQKLLGTDEIVSLDDSLVCVLEKFWVLRQSELNLSNELNDMANEYAQQAVNSQQTSTHSSSLGKELETVQSSQMNPTKAKAKPEVANVISILHKCYLHMTSGSSVCDMEVLIDNLYELELYLGDLDNSGDFYAVGGWKALTALLDTSPRNSHLLNDDVVNGGPNESHEAHDEMFAIIYHCIGTAIKNIESYQLWMIEEHRGVSLLELLISRLSTSSSSENTMLKLLYSISSSIRGNSQVQRYIGLLAPHGISSGDEKPAVPSKPAVGESLLSFLLHAARGRDVKVNKKVVSLMLDLITQEVDACDGDVCSIVDGSQLILLQYEELKTAVNENVDYYVELSKNKEELGRKKISAHLVEGLVDDMKQLLAHWEKQ